MGHHHVRVEISADRPEIGRIMLPTPPDTSKLFPSKNAVVISQSFGRNPKFVFWVLGVKKRLFFVAFIALLGTTMLFFEKFKIRAFRKVYGLWDYFQPLKSYITLKFRGVL